MIKEMNLSRIRPQTLASLRNGDINLRKAIGGVDNRLNVSEVECLRDRFEDIYYGLAPTDRDMDYVYGVMETRIKNL